MNTEILADFFLFTSSRDFYDDHKTYQSNITLTLLAAAFRQEHGSHASLFHRAGTPS